MALTHCKECGNQISDKAKACPKCGAANKNQKSPMWQFSVLLVFSGWVVNQVLTYQAALDHGLGNQTDGRQPMGRRIARRAIS